MTPAVGDPALAAEPVRAVAFQQNAAHTGAVDDAGLVPPLRRSWSVDTGGELSYPLIFDGRVVVTTPMRLSAFDLATGAPLWSAVVHDEYSGEHWAAYGGGRVVVLEETGMLTCVDPSTGATWWTIRLGRTDENDRFDAAPVVDGGTIYVNGADHLIAVDAATGAVRWRHSLGYGLHSASSPALDATRVYVATHASHAYAVNRDDGSLAWSHSDYRESSGEATTAVSGGRLYAGAYTGWSYDLRDGSRLGSYETNRSVAVTGTTLVAVGGYEVSGRDAATLGLTWTRPGARPEDGYAESSPLVVGSAVYTVSSDGRLQARALADGAPLWHEDLGVDAGYMVGAPRTWNALGAGPGTLVVPAGRTLSAFTSVNPPPLPVAPTDPVQVPGVPVPPVAQTPAGVLAPLPVPSAPVPPTAPGPPVVPRVAPWRPVALRVLSVRRTPTGAVVRVRTDTAGRIRVRSGSRTLVLRVARQAGVLRLTAHSATRLGRLTVEHLGDPARRRTARRLTVVVPSRR